ncbi:glycosyltransferase family 4 protein [Mucilaginibacter sp. RCC_168]|uniref:glycosyltransferase family 4 protein n=1 Tax=Mucilaginibacter sp. RCC_168 TaxID=3239221 RepID=UPI003526A867
MKNSEILNKKIKVNFFQRRPRKGFSFSLEFIFEDIRKRLKDKIDATVYVSKCYNDGYYSKFVNTIEAGLRQGDDINHVTGEIHFLDLLMRKKRVVLTILDCGMMIRKKGLVKKIIQWLYLKAPVSKAKIVTAISEVTKNEIISYTGVDPSIIRVIPVAVSSLYQPYPKVFNKEKPIILHIGTGYNKNLVRLIEAIRGINCHLTIVGKLSDEYLSALKENDIDYSYEYNISNERMLEKYKECDILAFVSIFEGFGMPIVEANTVERVVVTSRISSMPEVADNAACLVDPYDIEDIRSGILKVINDETFRENLINNGRTNRLKYNGDRIADMYFQLYQEIYAGN